MRTHVFFISALSLLILLRPASSQEVTARMADGSHVRLRIDGILTVETRYGVLTIPCSEIRCVEFGLHVTPEVSASIKSSITDLGSASFKDREAASKALVYHGPMAYQAVCAVRDGPDLEAAKRAAGIAAKIEDQHHAADLMLPDFDVVTTKVFQFSGKITTPGIKAESRHFGDLVLKLSDLRRLTFHSLVEADIEVPAGAPWTDTKIHVDEPLKIKATGHVDLWPQGPGQYTTTPKGYTTAGKGGKFMAGALIGKVGDGEPFLVGEESVVKASGRLRLRIVESPWNNESSGAYKVSIRAER